MKLIFKNVGQGDGIILTWTYKGKNFIGIIDANIYNKSNPVLDELKILQNYKIYFIIISHPHFDHFSGILDILNFIEAKQIPVKYFAHTLVLTPEFLQWTQLESEKHLLAKTIHKALQLYKNGIIKNIGILTQNWSVKLTDEIKLRILSPSDLEKRLFIKCMDFRKPKKINCRYSANLLSTIIQIFNSKHYVLLTSDSLKSSYERLKERNFDDYFESLQLILTQIPHHGSKDSLFEEFWLSLKKKQVCPAVISVGKNIYGHPDREVVDFFKKNGYEVFQTGLYKKSVLDLISYRSNKLEFTLFENDV